MLQNRQSIAILFLVLGMAASGCSAGAGNRAPKPTATPNPALQGRFLWLAQGQGDVLSVIEYGLDTLSPKTLLGNIPHKAGWEGGRGVFSRDGNALMIYDEDPLKIMVVDIPTGVIKPLPLPGVSRLDYSGIWGAFSPDNSLLAYALTGSFGYSKSGLYVFNLASGETSTLYEAPCSSYVLTGDVCGAVLSPLWIDQTTLIFNGFKGEMPEKIDVTKSNLNPIGSPHIPSPNRTFVVTIDGTVLQEFETVLENPEIQGKTLFVSIYTEDAEACYQKCQEADADGSRSCSDFCPFQGQWFNTDDVKQGVIKSRSSTLNYAVLSPDGKFLLNYLNGLWHLIDIRDGTDKVVENLAKACGDRFPTWSPNGKYIACMSQAAHQLQIVSLDGSPDLSLPLDTTGNDLFVWVP
jgi:hypothetical protein